MSNTQHDFMIRFMLVIGAALSFDALTVAAMPPDHVILGYSAVWRDDASPPADYNFAGITHIARAFIHPNGDGSLELPAGYFDSRWEAAARRNGVKLLMSLGGGAAGAENWVTLATHPQNLGRFLDRLSDLMSQHQYDGVDVDWEPMPATAAEGQAYTSFLAALRRRFPHAVLTTALDDWADQFSWADVTASVDYVNVMTYDYAGPWTGYARLATNLHPAGDYPAVPGHSVEEGMRKVIDTDHVPASKLLLGMNFWAYRFRADRLGDPFPKNQESDSDDLSFPQVLDLLQTGHYQQRQDVHAAAPYLLRNGGGSVICFDNPDSVRQKCDFAKQLGCAGVMIWNLGADQTGKGAPLTDAAVAAFGGRPGALTRSALQTQITVLAQDVARLSERLHAHPLPNDPVVPSDLSKLSQDQLVDLDGRLEKQWGILDDLWWSRTKSRP